MHTVKSLLIGLFPYSGIVRPVMEVYPHAWLFFVPFILVSAFVMLNLFVAVIVDTMANLGADGEETDKQAETETKDGVPVSKDEIERLYRELAEIKAMLREQSPR